MPDPAKAVRKLSVTAQQAGTPRQARSQAPGREHIPGARPLGKPYPEQAVDLRELS